MNQKKQTAPHLLAIEAELMAREPIFHRPEFGTSREDFERMTASDFWEIGASGRRYDRAFVLDVLEQRQAQAKPEQAWETTDFRCQKVALDLYLVTYTLRQDERTTLRSTLWRRVSTHWEIVFHQGTVVA